MHPLEQLDFPTRVAKRAQYEAFEFSLTDGGVRVRNCSHPDPSDHEYLVTVTDGVPATCECPADAQYDGACKHRVAVAIRRPVLDAVTNTTTAVAADGGSTPLVDGDAPAETTTTDADPDDTAQTSAAAETEGESECADCSETFPCWPCVRRGRADLPE